MSGLSEPERWEGGDRDGVELTVLPNEAVAMAVGEGLREAGVVFRMLPAHDVLPAFGAGVGTPVRVMVREEDAERARGVMEEVREVGSGVDWDAVDVGEAEDPIAAKIAARDGGGGSEEAEWDASEAVLRAKAMRRYGMVMVAVGIGCVFAYAGMDFVLFGVLGVSAVWLGRAHAISRKRKRFEKWMREEEPPPPAPPGSGSS